MIALGRCHAWFADDFDCSEAALADASSSWTSLCSPCICVSFCDSRCSCVGQWEKRQGKKGRERGERVAGGKRDRERGREGWIEGEGREREGRGGKGGGGAGGSVRRVSGHLVTYTALVLIIVLRAVHGRVATRRARYAPFTPPGRATPSHSPPAR